MRCKWLTIAVAALAWGVCLADLLPMFSVTIRHQAFALSVALVASAWLLLCAQKRPVAAVYQEGYQQGRRDALAQMDGPGGGAEVISFERSAAAVRRSSRRAADA